MPSSSSGDRFLGGANQSMGDNLSRNERTVFTSYRLVGALLLFGGAGWLLDRSMDTAPWLLLTGILVGILVGFVGLYRLVRR